MGFDNVNGDSPFSAMNENFWYNIFAMSCLGMMFILIIMKLGGA
jgi:hypothetical protein